MIIGAADSMREAIMLLFQEAGHGFKLYGESTTTKTETGHEIGMWRSGEIIKALDSNAIDLAVIGSDIITERNIRYEVLRRKPPKLHRLQVLPKLGRQYEPLELQLVIPKGLYDSGVQKIQESMIIVTEHPFTMRKNLEEKGFKPQFIGRNGSPLENDKFRVWAARKNEETKRKVASGEAIVDTRMIVGIDEIDGKVPTTLIHRLGDVGTIITETGITNFDNRLEILEKISEVHMVVVARQAYIDENPTERQAEVHEFGRQLLDAYAKSRREYMSRRQQELETLVGGSPER